MSRRGRREEICKYPRKSPPVWSAGDTWCEKRRFGVDLSCLFAFPFHLCSLALTHVAYTLLSLLTLPHTHLYSPVTPPSITCWTWLKSSSSLEKSGVAAAETRTRARTNWGRDVWKGRQGASGWAGDEGCERVRGGREGELGARWWRSLLGGNKMWGREGN